MYNLMNKKVLKKILSFCLSGIVAFASTGCAPSEPGHTHAFERQVATQTYLKDEATCQSAQTYYYSCECGEKGSETFTFGSPTSHNLVAQNASVEYLKTPASCTQSAVYYKSCTTCGLKGQEVFSFGNPLEHDFSAEIVTSEYIKEQATCTQRAEYYKSCVECGEKSEETFFVGDPLEHEFSAEIATSEYLKENANCSNGAVYYKSCIECGEKGTETFTIGEHGDHDFSGEVATSVYLKTPASCTQVAEYYKSCITCGLASEDFFSYGDEAHEFTAEIVEDKYFKESANCSRGELYYKSCAKCGEKGEETFVNGRKVSHDYSAEIATEEFLYTPATCMQPAVYFKSCTMCGKIRGKNSTFVYGEVSSEHNYDEEIATGVYLKEDATFETSAIYYKSCLCGKAGEETFSYGEPLREYSEAEKVYYAPTSLTVSLYDAQNGVYGFTYNTLKEPLRPVIQIEKGEEFTDAKEEYHATVSKETSYLENNDILTYYIVKAEIKLDANETYVYRAYDKHVDVGTPIALLQTKDTKSTKFTFAHVSDSQMTVDDYSGKGSGVYFAQTLSALVDSNDFIVHTGDVVQYAQYEGYWTAMLHENFRYLSKIPMMAVSGNHETSFSNGMKETFKHFNYKLPNQASTENGFFYSFVYGNVKFIMINTNDLALGKLKSEQYDWVVNELKNNTATWTFVAMHNPMYSVGKWGAAPSMNSISLSLREQLQGLFAQYGVDVVLQGHDHVISRTFPIDCEGKIQTETLYTYKEVEYTIDPKGVIYVMNGPAGNQARGPYATDSTTYKYQQSSNTRSWAEFEVDGNKIVVTIKYTDGINEYVYQKWGIEKTNKND